MPSPIGFNLLVVKNDGSGVFRLTFPRWLLGLTVGGLIFVVSTLFAIHSDYLSLRQQRAHLAQFHARFADQQVIIDDFERRARGVRAEIDSWRDLHARIWEPFGPEAGPAVKRSTGIGGGTTSRAGTDSGPAAVREEMDRLAVIVKEEGESLRALDRFLARAGKVLASLPSRWPPTSGKAPAHDRPLAAPPLALGSRAARSSGAAVLDREPQADLVEGLACLARGPDLCQDPT
jgi:hypothetical protein